MHKVLAASDPDRPGRVAGLVHGKYHLPYLSRLVSGTVDVDRCDYLLRDAHMTGVRYGLFDLPWLVRSILIHRPGGASSAPELGIDGGKGLCAMEEFILARLFMFQQVYFHKTTRAAEWMIGAVLRRAVQLVRDGSSLPAMLPGLQKAARGQKLGLSDYLELDDHALLGVIHAWETASDPILSDLAKRIRNRTLFKTLNLFELEPHSSTDYQGFGEQAVSVAREIAKRRGFDPDTYVTLDIASDVPFSDDTPLHVIFPRGAPRRASDVSFLLSRLEGQVYARPRLLFATELRDEIALALGA